MAVHFPFCSEALKKKRKREFLIFIALSLALLLTGLFFTSKAYIIMGASLSQVYICYLNHKACQKYYITITDEILKYRTPDLDENQIPLKEIKEVEINNKYLRLYLRNNPIQTIYITDFDTETIEKMKNYFEKFQTV